MDSNTSEHDSPFDFRPEGLGLEPSQNNIDPQNDIISEKGAQFDFRPVDLGLEPSQDNIDPQNNIGPQNNIDPQNNIHPEENMFPPINLASSYTMLPQNNLGLGNNLGPHHNMLHQNNMLPQNNLGRGNNLGPQHNMLHQNNLLPQNGTFPQNNTLLQSNTLSRNDKPPHKVVPNMLLGNDLSPPEKHPAETQPYEYESQIQNRPISYQKDTRRHAISDHYTLDDAIRAPYINFIDPTGTFYPNVSRESAIRSLNRTTHHLMLVSPGKVDQFGRADPQNLPTCKVISKIDLHMQHVLPKVSVSMLDHFEAAFYTFKTVAIRYPAILLSLTPLESALQIPGLYIDETTLYSHVNGNPVFCQDPNHWELREANFSGEIDIRNFATSRELCDDSNLVKSVGAKVIANHLLTVLRRRHWVGSRRNEEFAFTMILAAWEFTRTIRVLNREKTNPGRILQLTRAIGPL
jgi:hypothetical protein